MREALTHAFARAMLIKTNKEFYMKLQSGDYIDLRGMSVTKKREVQDFLRVDNKFWTIMEYRDDAVVIYCDTDYTLMRPQDVDSDVEIHLTNNRTTELLQAMQERPEGDAIEAYRAFKECIDEGHDIFKAENRFAKIIGNDSLDNYVFCEKAYSTNKAETEQALKRAELRQEISIEGNVIEAALNMLRMVMDCKKHNDIIYEWDRLRGEDDFSFYRFDAELYAESKRGKEREALLSRKQELEAELAEISAKLNQ